MNYMIQLRNQEGLNNEKKNKRVSSYWWVYDDTNNLYNTNSIILEVRLVKKPSKIKGLFTLDKIFRYDTMEV